MVKIQIRLQPLRSVHNILDARCLIPDTRCRILKERRMATCILYLALRLRIQLRAHPET